MTYIDQGREIKQENKEYTSHNAKRLTVPEIKEICQS